MRQLCGKVIVNNFFFKILCFNLLANMLLFNLLANMFTLQEEKNVSHIREECLEGYKSILGLSKFNEVISGDDRGMGYLLG